MDPNEALRVIRSIVSEWDAGNGDRPEYSVHDAWYQLAETCQALDEWLSRGGFPPNAWVEPMKRAAAAAQSAGIDPLGPPNPAHGEMPEDVRTAVEDALDYRMGEASGLDDPDLDPTDREYALRYRRLLGK